MQDTPLSTLKVSQLKRAVAIREQIERLQKKLAGITSARVAPIRDGVLRRKKRRMSASARARISPAAKARRAKFRAKKAVK